MSPGGIPKSPGNLLNSLLWAYRPQNFQLARQDSRLYWKRLSLEIELPPSKIAHQNHGKLKRNKAWRANLLTKTEPKQKRPNPHEKHPKTTSFREEKRAAPTSEDQTESQNDLIPADPMANNLRRLRFTADQLQILSWLQVCEMQWDGIRLRPRLPTPGPQGTPVMSRKGEKPRREIEASPPMWNHGLVLESSSCLGCNHGVRDLLTKSTFSGLNGICH